VEKQQQLILKETMIKERLKKAIYRSEEAYQAYQQEKIYFQALRLYKANIAIYEILESYILECDESEKEGICIYLFHLEDWMNQFKDHEQNINSYTSHFVFERWEGAVSFPRKVVQKLKR